MEEHMTKAAALALIRQERAALEETLAGLSREQLTRPDLADHWSVKDILAHIAAWEGKMRLWVAESLQGQTPDRPPYGIELAEIDRLNEQLYAENKDKGLDQIQADFAQSYRQSLELVEGLAEIDLIDPDRFAWRQGHPLWHLVAANTWWHYKEHRETIEAWLEQSQP